jgi:hypothetical protein
MKIVKSIKFIKNVQDWIIFLFVKCIVKKADTKKKLINIPTYLKKINTENDKQNKF